MMCLGRAILMTLSAFISNSDVPMSSLSGWYWLIEAGPYSYIMTGDILIIFLLDLLKRLYNRSTPSLWYISSKLAVYIGMIAIVFCYIVPGIFIVFLPDN